MSAEDAAVLKKTIARKEREVDYKITHFASFADNLEVRPPFRESRARGPG